MKKVIALLLVAVMVFSFAACNKDEQLDGLPSQAPIDKEELKQGWQEGVLTFANGKSVTLPCTIDEIIAASELSVPSLDNMKGETLKAGAQKSLNLVNSDTLISIKCKNTTKEDIKIEEATVIGYTINRTKDGNAKVKFANSLTVNAGRVDVEDVLGADDQAEEEGFSKYQGTNSKKKKVEMRVTYDSNNLVNAVSFEIK